MYSTANGTNTTSVITSCMILSCASDSAVKPMRLAGTCSRYSKSAMPHDTSAAIHHGLPARFLRCPYHAKVMNRFDSVSRNAHARAGCWASAAVGFMGAA
jgi:hypothetical protein